MTSELVIKKIRLKYLENNLHGRNMWRTYNQTKIWAEFSLLLSLIYGRGNEVEKNNIKTSLPQLPHS